MMTKYVNMTKYTKIENGTWKGTEDEQSKSDPIEYKGFRSFKVGLEKYLATHYLFISNSNAFRLKHQKNH